MLGMETRPRTNPIAAIAVVLLALLLAACGGADPTATTASSGQTTAAAAAGGATTGAAGTTAPAASTTTTTPAATTSAAATGAAAITTTVAAATSAAGSTATGTRAAASPSAAGAAPAPGAANAERYAIVPDKSKATYRVQETFVGRGVATAVGSSGDIKGDIFIDKQRPSASRIGTITVDISKLQSDSGRRDRALQGDWLQSSQYPTATFTPKRLEGLPDTPYTEGQELTFKIVGDLKVRTVTKEVTFDAKGKVVGDTFTGTATTGFNMTDFGVEIPDIAGFLSAENGVILEIEIEAKRAP